MSENLFGYTAKTTIPSAVTDHLSTGRVRLIDVGARSVLVVLLLGVLTSVLIALRIAVTLLGIVL